MHIARQRGEEIQPLQVFFPVEHRLIQMGDAPTLGNIAAKQSAQFLCGGAGGGVAPGAERRQLIAVPVKGQIPVHHGGDAKAPGGGQRLAQPVLHVRCQRRPRRLNAAPDILQRVGPVTVFQLVFPWMVPLGQHRKVRANQHRLDSGGAKLKADGSLL